MQGRLQEIISKSGVLRTFHFRWRIQSVHMLNWGGILFFVCSFCDFDRNSAEISLIKQSIYRALLGAREKNDPATQIATFFIVISPLWQFSTFYFSCFGQSTFYLPAEGYAILHQCQTRWFSLGYCAFLLNYTNRFTGNIAVISLHCKLCINHYSSCRSISEEMRFLKYCFTLLPTNFLIFSIRSHCLIILPLIF